ncbi:MAG: hypothetical protein WBW73_22820 [Rhodoplanes sp.]
MRIESEISGASVVMLGRFNPQIFQPFWLAQHNIISGEDAEGAKIGLIHEEITSISTRRGISLQVERERFSIDRAAAPLIRIADVACRIFGDLLPHTPIRQVGINRHVHFDVGTQLVRDEIGIRLAPREPWGEWGKTLSWGEGPKHGGLQSLTLIQRDVPGRPRGWVQTKIEPSKVIGRGRSGIYMEVNDHYEAESTDGTDEIVEIVRTQFDASMNNAESIIDQIMSLKR